MKILKKKVFKHLYNMIISNTYQIMDVTFVLRKWVNIFTPRTLSDRFMETKETTKKKKKDGGPSQFQHLKG